MSEERGKPPRDPLPSVPQGISRTRNTDETVMRKVAPELLEASRRSQPDRAVSDFEVEVRVSMPDDDLPPPRRRMSTIGKLTEHLLRLPKPSDFRPRTPAAKTGVRWARWLVLLVLIAAITGAILLWARSR